MSDKTERKQQDDFKTVDVPNAAGNPTEQDNGKTGLSEVDKGMSHRSNQSAKEGGQNEQQGEPNPGYGSVAPGMQGGGKR